MAAQRAAETARRAAEAAAEAAKLLLEATKRAIAQAARIAALLLQGKIKQFVTEIRNILKTSLAPAFGKPQGPATGNVFRFANGY